MFFVAFHVRMSYMHNIRRTNILLTNSLTPFFPTSFLATFFWISSLSLSLSLSPQKKTPLKEKSLPTNCRKTKIDVRVSKKASQKMASISRFLYLFLFFFLLIGLASSSTFLSSKFFSFFSFLNSFLFVFLLYIEF